jgi:hypothetical protein
MDVRLKIRDPQTELFRRKRDRKHEDFRAGPEIIPDVVLFAPEVAGDWRRRRAEESLHHLLLAIEIKASERAGGRLGRGEVLDDIRKLAAFRQELRCLGRDMHPVAIMNLPHQYGCLEGVSASGRQRRI